MRLKDGREVPDPPLNTFTSKGGAHKKNMPALSTGRLIVDGMRFWSRSPRVTTWEYTMLQYDERTTNERFDRLGADGWELAGVTASNVMIFKRPAR